jgi:hypothetical protein
MKPPEETAIGVEVQAAHDGGEDKAEKQKAYHVIW